MPDDFEPDVATDGDADGGSPPPDETPDDATPEGEPAEPSGDGEAEPEPTPGDDTPKEPSSAAGRSERLQKLLAKYGGDEDKMVDAYWEQAKSLSALDEKVDKLLEKVNSSQLTPEQEARLIADDPDVKEIGTELASLDADIKILEAEDRQLVAAYGKLETTVKALEAKLEFAPDDISKLDIKREIAEAKREQRDVQRDWRSTQSNMKQAQRQLQVYIRQFREAEMKAKAKRDQAKQREGNDRAARIATKKEFDTAVQTEAESYGIDLSSRTYGVLQQSVRDRLVTYLRSLGPDAEGIDIPEAVSELVKEYADVMNLKKRFAAVSKQKDAVSGKPPAPGSKISGKEKVPPADKTGKYWHPDFVRARARRLLG